MIYWLMKHVLVGPLLWLYFRPWVSGDERVPNDGPVIIASNHLSFIDSMVLPLLVKRRIYFLAKSEYFTGKGIKGFLSRLFFKGTGMLPIDRSGGKASEASLNTGLQVLARGEILGLYPEGTRSPDGKLYRGRTGIARTVLAHPQAVVVPVAMIGAAEVQPLGKKIPKPGRVGVVFGEPLDFSRFAGLEGDRFVLRSITDEIVYELQKLSGQEYSDVYASSIRQSMARRDR